MANGHEVTGASAHAAPHTGSKLAAALVAAQGDLKAPAFDSQSTAFGGKPYRYASLQSVIGVVRPALAKHQLCVIQELGNDGTDLLVTTRLIHSSGESVESIQRSPCPLKPQDRGGVITYLRRYGLNALLCLAAEEDDDAGAAQEDARQAERPTKAPAARAAKTTERTAPPAANAQKRDDMEDKGTGTFTAVEAWLAKSGQGKFGPYEIVVLKTAEGPSFGSIKPAIHAAMRDAAGDNALVEVKWERNQKGGLDAVEIKRLPENGDGGDE